MAKKRGIESQSNWKNIHMQTHAAKKEFLPTISILSSFISLQHSLLVDPHALSFCVNQLGDTRENILIFWKKWKEIRNCGVARHIVLDSTFLNNFLKVGDLDFAINALEDMQKDGLQLDKLVYQKIVLAATKRGGDMEKALEIMKKMRESGIIPGIDTYNPLIHAMATMGNKKAIEEQIEIMKKDKISVSTSIFNFWISAAIKQGFVECAEYLFVEMENFGTQPDTITFSPFITASAKQGNMERVEFWMEKMREQEVKPDGAIFNTLIDVCTKNGDNNRVKFWFEKMQEAEVEPDEKTFGILIDRAAKKGDMESVLYFLEEMRNTGVDLNVVTYTSLIDLASRLGYSETVKYLLKEMRLSGMKPNLVTVRVICHGFKQRGEADKCSKIVLELATTDPEIDMWVRRFY